MYLVERKDYHLYTVEQDVSTLHSDRLYISDLNREELYHVLGSPWGVYVTFDCYCFH